MKKVLVSAFAAAMSAAAFAGMNNVTIMFSTPGPDTYSDGTPVLDGERYALVWTPGGEAFAGINTDATAAGASKVAVSAPVATGGHCPNVLFQVDEGYAAANYKGGSWSVVLLDTRKFKLNKDGTPVLDEFGNRVAVSWGVNEPHFANGYGVIGNAVANASGFQSAGGIAAASETPSADIPNPVVKGISFDDENVFVTVESTSPALKYALVSGDTPDKVDTEVAGKDASSYGSESSEIVLIKAKKSGGEFFKVNAK